MSGIFPVVSFGCPTCYCCAAEHYVSLLMCRRLSKCHGMVI